MLNLKIKIKSFSILHLPSHVKQNSLQSLTKYVCALYKLVVENYINYYRLVIAYLDFNKKKKKQNGYAYVCIVLYCMYVLTSVEIYVNNQVAESTCLVD